MFIFAALLSSYFSVYSHSVTMVERPDYDALAQDINLEDITSCERNANILRMLRDGHPNWDKHLYIVDGEEEDEEDASDEGFFVEEGDDLGWLGYFVGKSKVLENLHIWSLPGERDHQINRFFDGMSQNRSIKFLAIHTEIGDDSWIILGGFFENNHNISNVDVFGQESAQNFASALGRMNHHSLEHLSMNGTGISDEGVTEVATALKLQVQLKSILLSNNNIGRDGCIALGSTLSRWPASNSLEVLNLHSNVIDDGGIQALVSGLMNCRSLTTMNLARNRSITADGLRSFYPLFQSESHSLEHFLLSGINFGDDGATTLAEGLRGNKSLKTLTFDVEATGITTVGWSAFSRLLCDTSTVNNTYLSNHTLTRIGNYDNEGTPDDIQRLLTMNKHYRRVAAICKILQSHSDLDMEPFFKLKMKFLPAIMSWFRRVWSIEDNLISFGHIDESERSCQSRKLSALYKFVRGMPDLTIIGYWEGRMIHIEAKKRRLVDEIRRLEYEEDITRERLGLSAQPMDEASASRNKRMRLE
jgi:hypothetical protein